MEVIGNSSGRTYLPAKLLQYSWYIMDHCYPPCTGLLINLDSLLEHVLVRGTTQSPAVSHRRTTKPSVTLGFTLVA